MRWIRILPLLFIPVFVATPAGTAPQDSFRLGLQVLGQNIAGITTEWVFSQNGLGLEVGIFDALNEPVLTAYYRRYIEIPGLAQVGLAPSIGAELICMTNLSSLSTGRPSVLGAIGATLGLDWTFLTRFSLALDLHGFYGFDLITGAAGEPGFSPSLSARIAF